ncbi:MAG: hypothetical protein VB118_02180 [Oscillospiraceae bacterium]|nr:hypothetical protein [Oscillospiraceae bacterium]
MKKIMITILIIVLLVVSYSLISYMTLVNEVNKAPIIYNLSDNQKNKIIKELQLNIFLPDNTEIVSLQLFSDTRNPSALIVIKTDNYNFDNLEFKSINEDWTNGNKEIALTPNSRYPFIIVNGEHIWPVKATEYDQINSTILYLYPKIDNSSFICIYTSRYVGNYFDIVKEAIAKNNAFYFLWK